jgi:hypothetical protein
VAPRIVGSHFREDGRPKRGYLREEVARAEAARLGMSYYRCDFCDRFHLTSGAESPGAPRRGRRRGPGRAP